MSKHDGTYQTDEELIANAEMEPCVGVCKSDETTGWCYGCGRTDEEIKEWFNFDKSVRDALEVELPDRVKTLIERRRAERGGGTGRRASRRRA